MLKTEEEFQADIDIEFGNETVTLAPSEDLAVVDLTEDMKTLPGQLSWYISVRESLSRALDRHKLKLKAYASEFATDCINDNPKIAQWKVSSALDGDSTYIELKDEQNAIESMIRRLDGNIHALDVKAELLRSVGAMSRSEMSNLNIVTKSVEQLEEALQDKLNRS